jgi:hypothetical protein
MEVYIKVMRKPTDVWAKNITELADQLGVTRQVINQWKRDERYREKIPTPKPDGRHSVSRWKAFITDNGLMNGEYVPSEDALLKRESLSIKVSREKLKLEVERGEYVKRSIVIEGFQRNLSKLFNDMQRIFVNELPARMRGMTEVEMSAVMADSIQMIQELSSKRETFNNDAAVK